MSKAAEKIKALLAQYEVDHPGTLKIKTPANKWQADIATQVKSQRARAQAKTSPLPPATQHQSTKQAPVSSTPRTLKITKTANQWLADIATQEAPVSSTPHRRTPPGLMWTTVDNIPVLKALDAGYQNYAAVVNVRPAGTYTIYKLDPRKAISYRCLAKDIHHYISQDLKNDATLRENIAFTKRQKEAKNEADNRAFRDQPGFYVVPGESVGPDDRVYNATGPYCRFEAAGIEIPLTSEYITTSTPSETTDVEDAALETARSLEFVPNINVKIIEARNPVEAAAGNGHVWWQDGLFRGPPVDPRQKGFGWCPMDYDLLSDRANLLKSYTENNSRLEYSKLGSTLRSLISKREHSTYRHDEALEFFQDVANGSARKYGREHNVDWKIWFPPTVRSFVAQAWLDQFEGM